MTQTAVPVAPVAPAAVDYQTHPSRYRHWKLSFEGAVATLSADFDENAGLRPGYKLKLNSYDLGVDIELHDALNRIRFEHPNVRSVVVTIGKDRIFCSGANIFMLGYPATPGRSTSASSPARRVTALKTPPNTQVSSSLRR